MKDADTHEPHFKVYGYTTVSFIAIAKGNGFHDIMLVP